MKKPEIKHITVRNQKLFCINCGGEHPLVFPLGIKEMTKKIEAFNELHGDCKKTWEEPKADQSQNVLQKANWWITNGETGLSSKTMWSFFLNLNIPVINHPHDPDDFGRCYKLLEAVPEWKERIPELSKLSEPWKNLSENWDKLTQMYEQNQSEDWQNYEKIGMYEFMKTLIN
jgi:hypothetical protein